MGFEVAVSLTNKLNFMSYDPKDRDEDDYEYSQDDLDNHSDQMNQNNDAYWQSRGYDERPDDWEDRDE